MARGSMHAVLSFAIGEHMIDNTTCERPELAVGASGGGVPIPGRSLQQPDWTDTNPGARPSRNLFARHRDDASRQGRDHAYTCARSKSYSVTTTPCLLCRLRTGTSHIGWVQRSTLLPSKSIRLSKKKKKKRVQASRRPGRTESPLTDSRSEVHVVVPPGIRTLAKRLKIAGSIRARPFERPYP